MLRLGRFPHAEPSDRNGWEADRLAHDVAALEVRPLDDEMLLQDPLQAPVGVEEIVDQRLAVHLERESARRRARRASHGCWSTRSSSFVALGFPLVASDWCNRR